jgi:predicted CXXCH cytochrome family protein
VAWARGGAHGVDPQLIVPLRRDAAPWRIDPATGTARRDPPLASRMEVETCARCHSRRSTIAEEPPGGPLLDTHRPALLDEGLYFPDGQIRDEVYAWGSFLQSAMYREGVTCTDCHDPHTARVLSSGNALCAQCHLPARFDTPEHHFHEAGSAGSRCVECHMPERTYMGVDARRDHSLRVPRPDLAARLGTPDACTTCHVDRDAAWAAAAVRRKLGEPRRLEPHWGEALHAAHTWSADAGAQLTAVARDASVPGIGRATAISLLPRVAPEGMASTLAEATGDADPLVRLAVAMSGADGAARALLRDPVRAVRLEAARGLAGTEAPGLAAVLDEVRAAEELNADRADARLNLAALALARGDDATAERELRAAIRLDPHFVPARVNLADLFRARGDEAEAERILREALRVAPEDAAAAYALGLLLVRTDRVKAALEPLRRAAELAPGVPRHTVVLALALERAGDAQGAAEALRQARERFPGDPEVRALAAPR